MDIISSSQSIIVLMSHKNIALKLILPDTNVALSNGF
jgi:hypothetical protein